MEQQLATVDPLVKLSQRERAALKKWERTEDKAPLSAGVALGLYELFLNGHSCEEIVRTCKNQGKEFSLGMVVDASIRYEWQERRDAHLKELFDGVLTKTKQAQVEAISFVTDVLAAAHKEFGGKVRQYLVDGDSAVFDDPLGAVRINSLKGYKEFVNLLLQLTGQGSGEVGKRTAGPLVNVNVQAGPAEAKSVDGKLKAMDAAALLDLVNSNETQSE